MTKKQWKKTLKKRLSRLPKAEREKALAYYDEIFDDKAEAGLSEARIVQEFGGADEAAEKILAEYYAETGNPSENALKSRRRATAGDTAARIFAVSVLFLFAGLPMLAVVFCLAITGAALFISGFAVILAGIIWLLYFLIQLCAYGGAAYVAHIGIGLTAAGCGALLVPLFLWLTKRLFVGCGKIIEWTGRLVRGKRETA